MFRTITGIVGGYAFQRRELRLLFAAIFLSMLGASLGFPLRMLYAQQHHASPFQLGLMAAAFLVAPLLAQIPMGTLVDRWGRVPVLLVALIVHPVLALLYIVFDGPWELIGLRLVEGIVVAAFQPAIAAYIADVTPQEHRSEAFGAFGATINAALFVGPLFGGLIAQYSGFTAAFIASFAVEILAVPLVAGHIREPVVHDAHAGSDSGVSWLSVFSLPLIAVYVSFFCMQAVFGTLAALWSIWIRDLGGSYTFIGLTYTVFALPQMILGASAGRLADRRGRSLILLLAGCVAGVIYILYGFVTSLAVIMVLGVIEGIAIMFQQPITQSLLSDAAPARLRGRAQGMAGTVGAVGGALAAFSSPPLYHHQRALPFAIVGVVMMVGTAVAASGSVVFSRRRSREIELAGEQVA